ncbi:MAG TPA: hypothetical protein VN442_23475 [Bryobacteraceae bacterium]|nr:hypothetical protein [Bryobacteraceae bacterium]
MAGPIELEQSTRAEILRLLKARGDSEAKMIAQCFSLTTMAVRRHLLKLHGDGFIHAKIERRAIGRPTTLYSLTALGDAQFSRDYAGLASELLSSLELLDGKAKIEAVFRKRRSTLVGCYRPRVYGQKLETRVRETAGVLTERGYMAEVRASGVGKFLLIEHNCAIRDVARCFPVACQEELCLIRDLAGGNVTRVSHLLAGDRNCSYVIEEGGGGTRQNSASRSVRRGDRDVRD